MKTMIELQGIQKHFNKHQVLNSLDLTIHAGELVGLVGVNGAGKTTLINLLLGLLPADHGQIKVLGQQPTARESKRSLGVMFQNDISIDRLQVKEMLNLQRSYYSNSLSLTELLSLGNLTALAKRRVAKLSGGQRRRLSFALAMAGNPELLFLDEPTVGMDVNSREQFWQVVEDLKQQGKTIIVTSHYLEEIESLATRILFLQNGQFIFDGPLADLQAKYGQTQVQFDTDLSLNTLQQLTGVQAIEQQAQHFSISTANSDAVIVALRNELTVLHHLTIRPNSLTQIFTTITKQVTTNE